MSILNSVKTASDYKNLSVSELENLSEELREKIISVCNDNGGHLASNLGIVETTVALYKVFDFPKDKLIFDVGHQCYAHKILSDRKDKFSSIRLDGGISGFPDKDESEYDAFTVGHAGTSLSAGLGYAIARDKLKEDYAVINVVGDGALVNGLNLEALCENNKKPKNFIVIFNDNGMSISKNKNGFYNIISKRTTKKSYVNSKNIFKKIFGNSVFTIILRKLRTLIKRIFNKNSFIESYGFKYVGIVDGNNIKELVNILERVKNVAKEKAVFLHIKTKKGKGFYRAEERADLYHGVGKCLECLEGSFSKTLGEALDSRIEQNNKIVAITAGMKNGTGLEIVEKNHPDNLIDVGIAEEFAVTLSAGLASGGIKPVACVYSTFMQRAYDQILHDVCIQNLPVIFCLDRAGLVGSDGKTHQGVFDLSYLSHIPHLKILSPCVKNDLGEMLDFALEQNSPVAIRYSKNYIDDIALEKFSLSPWCIVNDGDKLTILAVGGEMLKLALDFSSKVKGVKVIAVRQVKPLDTNILGNITSPIFTLEENSLIGGFGSEVNRYLTEKNKQLIIKNFGVKDEFVSHGSIAKQREINGLTLSNLLETYNSIVVKG